MSNTANYCLKIVNQLYENISGLAVSVQDRNKLEVNDSSLTYGELTDQSLTEILEVVNPQPGEVFYDLGSGAGKPVLWASVLYDWSKCCGIELLEGLYSLSVGQSQKFLAHPKIRTLLSSRKLNIQFFNENFLNFNFSDAKVILINATAFSYDLWQSLLKIVLTLPKDVRIITMTKKINTDEFELIHSGFYLMSWGMNSVNIYKKVK